jgi:hypothetical protein
MAQIKPAISRAIAVVTTTFGFLLAASRRHRLHNRTCAFQEMSRTFCGKASSDRTASD